MAKKLLLVLVLMLTASQARADFGVIDTLKALPGLKQGAAYDVAAHKVNYLTTLGVLRYDAFGLDVGYSSDDKAVATLSYDIGGLRKFGIDTPITNLIDLRAGVYFGYGRLTGGNEFSWGPEITVINVKF